MKRFIAVSVAALTLAALPFVGGTAFAHDYKQGGVHVDHPWSRATAPQARNGAAYFVLNATGADSDRLLSATSPVAEKIELHTHLMEDGVMKMRPVTAIEVTPGSPTMLQPGGLHVMLLGLKTPLVKGEKFPLTLRFEKAGELKVDVNVEDAGAGGGAPGNMHKH